ncbi:MAG: DUF2294 domain-containing protein [Chroococcidiopsidaceae cyanobacterium CP_BM_ER_R8_30]|nr:DUF2294 domain-containing protein [Chroococcidiopsidaceae cyanobacterium CP_BM_ER_R8_30]
MKYEDSAPNSRQLEQSLSQQIQVLYLNCMGHKPTQVSCQLLDQSLTIVVNDPTTAVERFLVASGKQQLAEQVRASIHKAFQPQLKALIEEVLMVSVTDLLGNSSLQSGRTSVTAFLAAKPEANNLPS